MLRHGFRIGRILAISIDLDYSWFPILGSLAWLLATNYYPAQFQDWGLAECWVMRIVTAFMLFVCVLIHELGHSMVARRFGLSVPRITLFIPLRPRRVRTG